MQNVSTYNSHLQAKLRTVIALQGGCAHLGSHMAYSVFLIHNVTYIYCAIVSRVKCVPCARRVSYRGTEAQPNPPLHQGNQQPRHKTKNEVQPPHK